MFITRFLKVVIIVMINKTVKAMDLANILLLEKSQEQVPDVFRLQPEVNLIITFNTWIDFVMNYLAKDTNCLSLETNSLQGLITMYKSTKLTNFFRVIHACYQRDITIAIFKELYFSVIYKRRPTMISHSYELESKLTINLNYSIRKEHKIYDGLKAIQERLKANGFWVEIPYNDYKVQWNYVIALLYLANEDLIWDIEIK